MLAVFYFDYLLQDLVSLCSKNFKEINLQPWLHSHLFAGAYYTCVQIGFVNVSIVWRPRVEVVGVGGTCCLTFIGILKAVANSAKLFYPKIKGITFKSFS